MSALLIFVFSAGAFAAGVEVQDARLRLLPGDLPAAGYFSINNVGEKAAVLVGAKTPAFERATVHKSVKENDTARMVPVPRLALEPGEEVKFAPGGYHLMLMERTRPLAVGDEINVTLMFEDGRRVSVAFQAISPASL
jgi:copper(I)-binding protein